MRRPVARQHGQPAPGVEVRCRKCRVQGTRRNPAHPGADPGPAQAAQVFRPEHEVQAATEGVAVDEQHPVAAPGRLHGRRHREHGRTGATPAPDDGEHGAVAAPAFHGLRECGHQPRFRLRQ